MIDNSITLEELRLCDYLDVKETLEVILNAKDIEDLYIASSSSYIWNYEYLMENIPSDKRDMLKTYIAAGDIILEGAGMQFCWGNWRRVVNNSIYNLTYRDWDKSPDGYECTTIKVNENKFIDFVNEYYHE